MHAGTENQLREDVLNWINSDINDPGFNVYNDDKICMTSKIFMQLATTYLVFQEVLKTKIL